MYYTKRLPYLIFILLLVVISAPYATEYFDSASRPSQENNPETARAQSSSQTAFFEQSMEIPPASSSFPPVQSEGVLVRDMATGETLFEKNSHVKFPVASLTKIMTALLMHEIVPLNQEYRLSAEAKKTSPKISFVPAGSFVRGEDIITYMMIESANDMAYLAAEKIGQTLNFKRGLHLDFQSAVRSAVLAMNERALEIGLKDTNFVNPAGLDDKLHYSTAEDLFLLMKYVFEHAPSVWHVSQYPEETLNYRRESPQSVYSIRIKNTNPLTGNYRRILGSKTGFTDEAGQALVLIYQLTSGRNIAIIVLKSEDRFGDAEKIIQWLDNDSL